MRIAIVTPGFSASDEDWCIPVLQDLVCELGEQHEVQVFATCYPHRCDQYQVKGITVHSFGDGKAGRVAWCVRQYRALRALIAIHDEEPFDVVHGFWADGGGVVAAQFKRMRGIPCIVTVMAGELTFESGVSYGKRHRMIAGRLARYGAEQADALVVMSEFHRRAIVSQNVGLSPIILEQGMNIDRFSPEGPTQALQGDIPVLVVGSLVPVKGHESMLEALVVARRQAPGLHLHIIGSGTLSGALGKLVADSGLDCCVTLHGHVEHHDLPSYYRAARFCALSSWFESHGMVILEAAACRTVTIGSRVGSMPEFCEERFLCPPGNVPALAAAIIAVASDNSLAQSLGSKSRETVMARYAIQHTVSNLEKLYATTARQLKGLQR